MGSLSAGEQGHGWRFDTLPETLLNVAHRVAVSHVALQLHACRHAADMQAAAHLGHAALQQLCSDAADLEPQRLVLPAGPHQLSTGHRQVCHLVGAILQLPLAGVELEVAQGQTCTRRQAGQPWSKVCWEAAAGCMTAANRYGCSQGARWGRLHVLLAPVLGGWSMPRLFADQADCSTTTPAAVHEAVLVHASCTLIPSQRLPMPAH